MTDEIIEAEVIRVETIPAETVPAQEAPRPKRLFETWRDYAITILFIVEVLAIIKFLLT